MLLEFSKGNSTSPTVVDSFSQYRRNFRPQSIDQFLVGRIDAATEVEVVLTNMSIHGLSAASRLIAPHCTCL